MTDRYLRLRRPLLWCDDGTAQVGLTNPTMVAVTHAWQEMVLTALDRGTSESELRHLTKRLGVARSRAALVRRLAGELHYADAPVTIAVLLQGHDEQDLEPLTHFDELAPPGVTFVSRLPADIVWVVCRWILVPQTTRTLVANDTPHLPIVITRDGAEIGPAIIPGETACASCLALDAASADPRWPAAATQLVGRRVADPALSGWGEIMPVALRLSRALLSTEPSATTPTTSFVISDQHPQRERQHLPNADCGCRLLAESERANADYAPRLEPTTARAFARHA